MALIPIVTHIKVAQRGDPDDNQLELQEAMLWSRHDVSKGHVNVSSDRNSIADSRVQHMGTCMFMCVLCACSCFVLRVFLIALCRKCGLATAGGRNGLAVPGTKAELCRTLCHCM